MKVSVIIPCYNQGRFLGEAIESVLDQTYPADRIEIIVVNDGSTDHTEEIALKYPVTLLSQPNKGLPSARNMGISASNGEYILPLDSDDKLHPRFLETTAAILANDSSVGVVHTHRQHFGTMHSRKLAEIVHVSRLIKKCVLNYCSLYRKEVWLEVGGYNPGMTLGYEDWDFWLSVAETSWQFHLVREVLFYYRRHEYSLRHVAKENHKYIFEKIRLQHPQLFK
jgi:glycosyltransferase involved in cell wall biosynthesis